eukprot:3495084-Pyramimonas_sp.AAC.1
MFLTGDLMEYCTLRGLPATSSHLHGRPFCHLYGDDILDDGRGLSAVSVGRAKRTIDEKNLRRVSRGMRNM